jgi:hypothetical protein
MKRLSFLFSAISLLGFTTAVWAEGGGIYVGQGYTVTVGEDGSYRGCDSKNRCLSIEQPASRDGELSIWGNNGFVYSLAPVPGTSAGEGYASEKFTLTVVNPRGKRILRRTLTAQGVGG